MSTAEQHTLSLADRLSSLHGRAAEVADNGRKVIPAQRLIELRDAPQQSTPLPALPGRAIPKVVQSPATQNPAGQLTPLKDPFADPHPEDGINLSDDPEPESPRIIVRPPNFVGLDERRKLVVLQSQFTDLQHVNDFLEANGETYRQLFLYPIVDRVSAQLAVQSYSPSTFRQLRLTYDQANTLLAQISERCARYGVTPPAIWATPIEDVTDTENGDDEF